MIKRPHHRPAVWKESIVLAGRIYEITARYPREEHYALASQMRRASVSAASHIAEGAAGWSAAEKPQFFRAARGSLSEHETQVEISQSPAYVSATGKDGILTISGHVGRMPNGLIASKQGRHPTAASAS